MSKLVVKIPMLGGELTNEVDRFKVYGSLYTAGYTVVEQLEDVLLVSKEPISDRVLDDLQETVNAGEEFSVVLDMLADHHYGVINIELPIEEFIANNLSE